MPEQFEDRKLYVVEGSFLNALQRLEMRLYHHDFKRINADESRNWANYLNTQLPSAFEFEDEPSNQANVSA